jgi:alkanesulfonate monooxygenase SsuD/methylene tetrahydromethanopterin reductase-like flavin-dependent oxidoreductase (luciferase family)
MHVGFGTFFQNLGRERPDHEVWATETEMAVDAEGLGYDSVWTVEHHFTDYTMSPNPLQFLSWVAGRTTRVKLGSMVCVLPWHDPVRLAEEASVLDHLSGGRLVLGIGRGLARVEFDGFGVDMADSRRLFTERAQAVLDAFETGELAINGHPLRERLATPIRPAPLLPLRGRTYASSISPESHEIMARLGVGIMVFLQKPWEQTVADIEAYAAKYREVNDAEPPKPLLVIFAACHRDPGRARQMFDHIMAYYDSTVDHYEFDNAELAKIPGYEYYGRIAERIRKHGREEFVRFLADLQPWGTPDVVAERVIEDVRRVDAAGVIAVASYGGMPESEARANQALFAERVLPVLRSVDVGDDVGLAAGAWSRSVAEQRLGARAAAL